MPVAVLCSGLISLWLFGTLPKLNAVPGKLDGRFASGCRLFYEVLLDIKLLRIALRELCGRLAYNLYSAGMHYSVKLFAG